MKQVSYFLCSLLFVLTITVANAQQHHQVMQAKADELFDNFSYIDAISAYQKLVKDKFNVDYCNKRLAEAYHNINDYEKSEIYYNRVIATDSGKADPQNIYNYAQALRENGKTEESIVWMNKFHTIRLGDSRGSEFIDAKAKFERIKIQAPFCALRNISANSDCEDFGAVYYKDKIVFASARVNPLTTTKYDWNNQAFLDLYVATKTDNGELEHVSKLHGHLNTRYHEGPACYNKAGTVMFFTRNNYYHKHAKVDSKGVNKLKLFRATLIDDKWVEDELPFNSNEFSTGHPSLSSDEKTLYFVSDRPGGFGETDIYKVNIKNDNTFGDVQNVGPTVNTEGKEMFPYVSNDEILYFSSDGHLGFGGLDIFATKITKAGGFKSIINLGLPANSEHDDFSVSIDKSNKSGYLASNRTGGKGDDDIYFINILRPLIQKINVTGIAKDKTTGKPIDKATVTIRNKAGDILSEIKTNSDGYYSFIFDDDDTYFLMGEKENYFDAVNNLVIGATTNIVSDLEFIEDKGVTLNAQLTDKKTKLPLDSVRVTITEIGNGKVLDKIEVAKTGEFSKVLPDIKRGDWIKLRMKLERTGYVSKSVNVMRKVEKLGVINLNIELDFTLEKPEVGLDLAKMIELKPIYFDLAKWNIRPDGAIELDKIAEAMKENPGMVVELGSHTDCRSSEKYNLELSDKRAKSSAAYIINKGIPANRIFGKGYGESKLINGCACEGALKSKCSEEEHQQNRRTEFIIVKMQ